MHRPAKLHDLTQTIGDGYNIIEEKQGQRRKIPPTNLANPEMNKVMVDIGAKKIKWLENMDSFNIDRKKLELVESTKVRANEFDEKTLAKGTLHADGRMHTDVIPVQMQSTLKYKHTSKDLRKH